MKEQLGIGEHETAPDGKCNLMTEERLVSCDRAPCLPINERLQRRVRPEDLAGILAVPNDDRPDVTRSDLFDAPPPTAVATAAAGAPAEGDAPGETPNSNA